MAKSHRSPSQHLPIFPYVTPEGRIVDAQWAPAIANTVLVADNDDDKIGATVHVREAKRREGFRMLRELYEAEGKKELFAEYMAWAKAVYRDGHTKAFPDRLLPAEVLERRKRAAGGEVTRWEPSEVGQKLLAEDKAK